MPKIMKSIAVLTALSMPVAATAQVFEAVNDLKVVRLSATDFDVIEERGKGARGIWCAAADYARVQYGGTGQQRIYVKTPRGPSASAQGRKSVVFTSDPGSLGVAPTQSVSVTVRTPGVGLTVNHAIQFCKDHLIYRDVLIRPRPNH